MLVDAFERVLVVDFADDDQSEPHALDVLDVFRAVTLAATRGAVATLELPIVASCFVTLEGEL